MSLALFSDRFWYPNGDLAAGVEARVFPQGINTLASLYANVTGTVALPNPVMTDASGVLTFYAAVGDYWVHIGDESVFISVGLSQAQVDLSTGIASGGELNVTGPQSFEILPFVGYIVDNTGTVSSPPSITKIDYPGTVIMLSGASLTQTITWWLMNSAQTIIQQGTRPTPTQRRTHLVLGASIFDIGSASLLEIQTLPVWLSQSTNQLVDLMDALGPFVLDGNRITPNGANLSVNKSAGMVWSRSFNLFVSGTLTDDPHESVSPAQSPVLLRRILRTVTTPTPALQTTIDPANYDLNGVLTPVGGGVNSATIQRFWLFAANTTALQVVVQYGQSVYGSLAAATAAIGAGTFTPAPITADAALMGYVAVIRTATNLSDPTQATFVKAGKFATP